MIKKVEIEQKEIEAPYELPEGWKWVQQNEVCRLTDGVKQTDADYPYLEVKYLRGTKEKEITSSGKFVKAGTKVILVDGENSGEVFTVPEDGYMGSTFKSLSIQNVDENYLQLFIATKKDFYRNNKKGSAIPHLDKKLFFNMPFPLPPTIAEQQRIVNRIENLFAKLDEAKEKARNAADSFETRKAAILHQAFTGSLTAKWRKENGVSDESWEEKKLSEVYIINPKVKADDDILASFIPMEKIEPASVNRFSFDVKYWGNIKKNHTQFQNGDVCFAKISPCFENGKAFIANGLENGIGAGTTELIILRSSEVDVRYTFYVVMNTSFVRGGCTTYSGTVGQQRISMDYVRNYKIPVPSIPEQQEIVRILDTVLEKERAAKSAAEQVLEQIALLKKSILARAFRGGSCEKKQKDENEKKINFHLSIKNSKGHQV